MEFDVAIIGGGPGGTSAAIRLRQFGFRVLLVEKDLFPREKLCGEFLSPEVGRLAAELGLESELLDAAPARINLVRLHLHGEPPVEMPLPAPALGLSRASLDHMLLRHAMRLGAVVLERTTAESVRRCPSGEFSLVYRRYGGWEQAVVRAVICAAGRWSRWSPQARRACPERKLALSMSKGRRGGLSRRPWARMPYAFNAHYESSIARANTLDLHFFPGGYCGLSHVEGGRANLCCLIENHLLREVAKAGADPSALLLRQPTLAGQLLGGKRVSRFLFAGPLVLGLRKPVHDSMLMVGDSAGCIDPFTGDGISIALHSGLIAARALEPALRSKCSLESALEEYARAYDRAFRRQFLWARWLRYLVGSPRATRLAARVAGASGRLRRKLFLATRVNAGVPAECTLERSS